MARAKKLRPVLGGFRVRPEDGGYVVVDVDGAPVIPGRLEVTICAMFPVGENGKPVLCPGAVITRAHWDQVRNEVEYVLNEQIERDNHGLLDGEAPSAPGRFRETGETHLSLNNLGREVQLLGFALEDAADEEVAPILAAWRAMHPAERWWLHRQCIGCCRTQGWRGAVGQALAKRWRSAKPRRKESAD